MVRLNSDGTVDAVPGNDLDFSVGHGIAIIDALAQQADGDVLIGYGWPIAATLLFDLVRVSPSGVLDTTFAPPADFVVFSGVNSLAVQGDQQILVASNFSAGSPTEWLTQLDPDGSPNAAFAANLGNAGGIEDSVQDVVLQDDGKIVIGGSFTSVQGVASAGVARLNSNGTVDAAFSAATGTGVTGLGGLVRTMDLQPDGKILVGGYFASINGVEAGSLGRFNADGSPDTAFNSALGVGFDNDLSGVAQQPDGKVVVADNTVSALTFKGRSTGTSVARIELVTVTAVPPADQLTAVGATVGVPVSASASNGAALAYSATGLPPGLSIEPTTGVITGTPTAPGDYDVVVTAEDPLSVASDTAEFAWTVVAVDVTSPGDQTGLRGDAVSLPVVASASDGSAVTFGATGLPPGLSIDPTSGVISGTLTTTGVSTVTVTATNAASGATASATFAWTVEDVVVVVAGLPDRTDPAGAVVNLPVGVTTNASALGFTAPGLPGGLSIDPVTGVISGTTTTGGVFAVTVTATHAASGVSDSATFTWTVVAVAVTSPGDQSSLVGVPVSVPVVATSVPDTAVEFGATGLPDGLSIDPVSGVITGTPTTVGAFTVIVTASDPVTGASGSATFAWSVGVVTVVVTGPGDRADAVGASVDVPVTATASDGGEVTFAAVGLPAGLSIDSVTGSISGTVASAGVSMVTVTATHTASGASDAVTFVWTVVAVDVTAPVDRTDAAGAVVDLPVVATSTLGPLTFTAAGLPGGLAIDAGTGEITGTTTAGGVFTVTVTATHLPTGADDSATFTWTVVAVAVTSPGDRTDAVGAVVSVPVAAAGTGAVTLAYTATGLPDGLSIDRATGVVTGTTTTVATSTVTVTATHAATGASASVSFTWDVVPVTLDLTDPGAQVDAIGESVDLSVVVAANLPGALTFSATGLPDGLSLDPRTGVITGTPATSGVWSVTITVQHDASGAVASISFPWTIEEAAALVVTITDPGDRTDPVGTDVELAVHAAASDGAALVFAAGGLPDGLIIDASTGVISGAPSSTGIFVVTVSATHPSGADAVTTFTWTITEAHEGILAMTGASVGIALVVALLLVAAGAWTVVIRRRHHQR